MNITDAAYKAAVFAHKICQDPALLDACGYTFKQGSFFAKIYKTVKSSSLQKKELIFKQEFFCLALGSCLNPFYRKLMGNIEDTKKLDSILIYLWRTYPGVRELFPDDSSLHIRMTHEIHQYMFFKPPYDSDKLKTFLCGTFTHFGEYVEKDTRRADKINQMMEYVQERALVESKKILGLDTLIDNMGLTK